MDYLIKTEKFHKVIIKRRYLRKINIKEITIRNLLAYYLSLACEKYNTESSFNKYLGINYDLRYYVSINNMGSYSYLSLTLNSVDPRFIEDESYNIELIMNSFDQCIKPVIKGKSFDNKLFKRAKEIYLSNLLYSLDNEHKNAIDFTINTYYNNTNGMVSDGNMDELNKITKKELYDYYLSILKDEHVDYICGNLDMDVNNTSSITVKDDYLFQNKGTFEPIIYHKANTNQCYLQIIYDVKSYTNSKDFYTSTMINYEFGGKSNSKLFQIIREKYGLCYHISSTYYGSRGIILLTAVINKNDLSNVISKIDDVFNNLLDDFDINSSKNYFKSMVKAEKDKMSYLINNKFMDDYFTTKFPSKNETEYYEEITMEDIKRVYKGITKDLLCVYGGDSDE